MTTARCQSSLTYATEPYFLTEYFSFSNDLIVKNTGKMAWNFCVASNCSSSMRNILQCTEGCKVEHSSAPCVDHPRAHPHLQNIKFLTFPRNAKLRQAWVDALQREDLVREDQIMPNHRLCNLHFEGGTPVSEDAVPTLFNLPVKSQEMAFQSRPAPETGKLVPVKFQESACMRKETRKSNPGCSPQEQKICDVNICTSAEERDPAPGEICGLEVGHGGGKKAAATQSIIQDSDRGDGTCGSVKGTNTCRLVRQLLMKGTSVHTSMYNQEEELKMQLARSIIYMYLCKERQSHSGLYGIKGHVEINTGKSQVSHINIEHVEEWDASSVFGSKTTISGNHDKKSTLFLKCKKAIENLCKKILDLTASSQLSITTIKACLKLKLNQKEPVYIDLQDNLSSKKSMLTLSAQSESSRRREHEGRVDESIMKREKTGTDVISMELGMVTNTTERNKLLDIRPKALVSSPKSGADIHAANLAEVIIKSEPTETDNLDDGGNLTAQSDSGSHILGRNFPEQDTDVVSLAGLHSVLSENTVLNTRQEPCPLDMTVDVVKSECGEECSDESAMNQTHTEDQGDHQGAAQVTWLATHKTDGNQSMTMLRVETEVTKWRLLGGTGGAGTKELVLDVPARIPGCPSTIDSETKQNLANDQGNMQTRTLHDSQHGPEEESHFQPNQVPIHMFTSPLSLDSIPKTTTCTQVSGASLDFEMEDTTEKACLPGIYQDGACLGDGLESLENTNPVLAEDSIPHSSCGDNDPMTPSLMLGKDIAEAKRRHLCQTCGKGFQRKSHLQRHEFTHAGEKPFVCETCGKKFTHASYLKSHELSHTGETPYVCEICGKGFIYASTYKCHINSHTGEKPFVCKTCGKGFTYKSYLERHEFTHAKDKPHVCKICGKGFPQACSLKSHEILHTGEKPYICKTCGMGFTYASSLKSHEYTHTGETPYVCKTCGKGFTYSSSLKNHEFTHTGEKPYVCGTCGIGFAYLSYLDRHVHIHTGRIHKCKTCGKRFTYASHLKNHEYTHTGEKPYVCKICGMGFINASTFKAHEHTHIGEKPYECETCGKKFKHANYLKNHEHTHSGEKPWRYVRLAAREKH